MRCQNLPLTGFSAFHGRFEVCPFRPAASFLVSARRHHLGLLVPTMPRDACAQPAPWVFLKQIQKHQRLVETCDCW